MEASALRRMIFAFQEKKVEKRREDKRNVDIVQERFKNLFYIQDKETKVKQFYFCNITEQKLMSNYCTGNKRIL